MSSVSDSISEGMPMSAANSPDLPAPPAIRDVMAARQVVARFMAPTPLHRYTALDELTGARIWVKHENHTPIGAFKLRGGLVFMEALSRAGAVTGVITASTGNHGQSIAYAARVFGLRAVIVVPEGANALKVDAIRDLEAEVVFHGRNFDEAKHHGRALAAQRGYHFISSGDEPDLIAGVATATWEILEQQSDLDYLFVPLGGGSGAAGACIVAHALQPTLRVVAVQSRQAPAACLTWRARTWQSALNQTLAEGLATAEPFMLPQTILWQHLHDFCLVDDEDILQAVAHYFLRARLLPEPAGACALAGAIQMRGQIAGKNCALIMSGSNISVAQLRLCLEHMDRMAV